MSDEYDRADLVIAVIDTGDAVELRVIKDRRGPHRLIGRGAASKLLRERVELLRRDTEPPPPTQPSPCERCDGAGVVQAFGRGVTCVVCNGQGTR